ncbi:hypothetical protein R6Q59_026618 [Mikania micrantha]
MELALSLGDTPKPFSLLDHHSRSQQQKMKDLGFCMGLGSSRNLDDLHRKTDEKAISSSPDQPPTPPSQPPMQLDLLPFSPVLRSLPQPSSSHRSLPWLSKNFEPASQTKPANVEVKPLSAVSDQETGEGPAAGKSSPNNSNSDVRERDHRSSSRGAGMISDEEENGLTRKKLRLTKEQSAYLEDSFKEHSTLNPKQKQALAKQLNLRPRQVEVWFQNRRARTKLKQTEVDCEYLKRCCETLTEENRRLQKELQELRALKASQPFFMQVPATTLTMCPSCERVATSATATAATPCQHPSTGGNRH